MGKREKIGKHYVERRKDGTFQDWVSIGASLRADRRQQARTQVKPGYGHQGDQRRNEGFELRNTMSLWNNGKKRKRDYLDELDYMDEEFY